MMSLQICAVGPQILLANTVPAHPVHWQGLALIALAKVSLTEIAVPILIEFKVDPY